MIKMQTVEEISKLYGLEEKGKSMLMEFMESENISPDSIVDIFDDGEYGIHIVLEDEITYYIMESEDDAEKKAYDVLIEDNYVWKEAVSNNETELGFDDWAKNILDYDGWDTILCFYDGSYTVTDSGYIYYRES